jgi:hypothetical protein
MGRFIRLTEGPGPNPKLFALYEQFEQLCDNEGPGAADEGDLSRLRQEMTAACISGNEAGFLAALSEAMLRQAGITNTDYLPL